VVCALIPARAAVVVSSVWHGVVCCVQEHANLLVEQNSVASLTAYNDDLKESRAQLANAVKQMEASSSRLRAELDQVGAAGPTAMVTCMT